MKKKECNKNSMITVSITINKLIGVMFSILTTIKVA